MHGGRIRTKLTHISEDRSGNTAEALRRGDEHVDRRAHRLGTCVVAILDNIDAAGGSEVLSHIGRTERKQPRAYFFFVKSERKPYSGCYQRCLRIMPAVDRYNCILYHASAGHDIEFASVAAVTESRDVMLRSRISRRGKIRGAAVGLSDVGKQGLVANKLEQAKTWQTFEFGPVLVEDGKAATLPSSFYVNCHDGYYEPRTAIGQLGPLHYIVIVVDGRREGYSTGASIPQLQQLFLDEGAEFAFNLDGGGDVLGQKLRIYASRYLEGNNETCPTGRILPVAGTPMDFRAGKPFDDAVADSIIESLEPDYISGLSVLGGEPMEPENQEGLVGFLERVRDRFPRGEKRAKTIWMYSGHTWEQLAPGGAWNLGEVTDRILDTLDVLVDGPFVKAEHDITLRFRGSRNQRIIDVPATLESAGGVVEWADDPVFSTHTLEG